MGRLAKLSIEIDRDGLSFIKGLLGMVGFNLDDVLDGDDTDEQEEEK
ncbi:MAG TPA: hypothetical protein VMW52_09470 [Phycisphaerae bacterium]|nr:hypothetical protein [Phycisphaerae bacterium]